MVGLWVNKVPICGLRRQAILQGSRNQLWQSIRQIGVIDGTTYSSQRSSHQLKLFLNGEVACYVGQFTF